MFLLVCPTLISYYILWTFSNPPGDLIGPVGCHMANFLRNLQCGLLPMQIFLHCHLQVPLHCSQQPLVWIWIQGKKRPFILGSKASNCFLQKLGRLLTALGIILPIMFLVILSYPFDAKNSVFYYRCPGRYEKIYDIQTGGEKKLTWCEDYSIVCRATRIIFFLITSNVLEIFFLGFAIWRIIQQSNSVSDMLSANVARNRNQ